MADEAKDIDKDNDITTIIFQAFKKAEPIIILASISLAIGAVVGSQGRYATIFNHSIISSFMFIFSFGFYVIYELAKKYWYPTRELEPDEYSSGVFNYNLVRFAPIYFAVIGIIFLIAIAYDFGTDLTKTQIAVQPKNPLPIFPLAQLFFILYFFIYLVYSIIKSLIIWKNSHGRITKKSLTTYLVPKSIFLIILLLLELNIISDLLGFSQFANTQQVLRYFIYISVGIGIVVIVKHIVIDYKFLTDFKKRKTKLTAITLAVSIVILLFVVPYGIQAILQGIGVLDKQFDIFEYAINVSKNILQHVNQSNTTISMTSQ